MSGHTLSVDPGSTSLTFLERVRSRDQQAWQQFVDLYGPLVYAWCRRWGLQRADAADLVQEVFHAVDIALPAFRHDRPGDSFRGWLWTITRNKLLNFLRRRQMQATAAGGTSGHQLLELLPALDDSSSEAPPGDSARLVRRAVELIRGEFEERSWQAFWRSAVDGHETAHIAADLNTTPHAVRKAKSRVLCRLRELLRELGENDPQG
jgi:RNA polymerase sigma-70 factor (ECF subfamily)